MHNLNEVVIIAQHIQHCCDYKSILIDLFDKYYWTVYGCGEIDYIALENSFHEYCSYLLTKQCECLVEQYQNLWCNSAEFIDDYMIIQEDFLTVKGDNNG